MSDSSEHNKGPFPPPPVFASQGFQVAKQAPTPKAGDNTQVSDSVMQWVPGYRLIRLLGAGASSEVYLASKEDDEDAAPVAIKILRTHLDENSDPLLLRSFEKEGKALRQIQHNNVLRCHSSALDRLGRPYLIMDYLPGSQTLQNRLASAFKRQQGLPLKQVRSIALQMLDGVAAAHNLDIIHRDLKPSNIMLVPEPGGPPRVKILDFGLAKFIKEAEGTKTEHFAGTLAYAAPEQTMGQSLRAWTDIYALAEIILELLTGRSLFSHLKDLEIYRLKMEKDHPIQQLVAQQLDGLEGGKQAEKLFTKALQRDPKKRFSNIEEFRIALLPVLLGLETGEKQVPQKEPQKPQAMAQPAQVQKEVEASNPTTQFTSFAPKKTAQQGDWLVPFLAGVFLSSIVSLVVIVTMGPARSAQPTPFAPPQLALVQSEVEASPEPSPTIAPQTPQPWIAPSPYVLWENDEDARDILEILKPNWSSLPLFSEAKESTRLSPPLLGNWVMLSNGRGQFDVHISSVKRCIRGNKQGAFTHLICSIPQAPEGWPAGPWAVSLWTKSKALK